MESKIGPTIIDSFYEEFSDINDYEKQNYTEVTENSTQTKNKSNHGTIFKKIPLARKTCKRKTIKLMNWTKFHRLSIIYMFLDDLERDHPAICTVSVIGKSVEGRDIKMLKISNSDASNSAVWIDGAIHAREWITAAVVTYIANAIVKNFDNLPKYVTNKDWYIVPVLNPDGYEYSHTGKRMWRKNRAHYGDGEDDGVDLNRNFSFGWGHNGDEGSSEKPEHVFYRGPAPFSEPESAAVRDTIMSSNSKFKVFLSFHSYYEIIIFPWGYKGEPCPNYMKLLEGGIAMARAIEDITGVTYKVGSTKDLTYYACGTSIDWSYGVANIPYSYMIELRSKKYKFKLPRELILENCIEIWNAAIEDITGVTYKVGSTKDLTYYACGTSIDWSYGVANIPYSYMIELRSKKYKFKLPRELILENCIEIWNAVKTLMKFVDENN